jgi:hypothetical protein
MKRDRMMPSWKQAKRVGNACPAALTEDQLDALARAHGSRLIRQPTLPHRNTAAKGGPS